MFQDFTISNVFAKIKDGGCVVENCNEKIQIETFFNEVDANKFLSTLLPSQVIDVKVAFNSHESVYMCLSYTIVFKVDSQEQY